MAPIRIPSGSYTSTASPAARTGGATWDIILKAILIGDSSVGKSSLLVRLTDDRFLTDPDPTIGVEFGSHLIHLDNGETVKIQVWDTAGSESFRSITRSYYRGAAGALLVYDITHRQSFLNAKSWLDDVRNHAEENVTIVLVGNMSDLVEDEPEETLSADAATSSDPATVAGGEVEEGGARPPPPTTRARSDRRRSKGKKREVTTSEAREFARQEGLLFLEASAKTGHNVEEAFTQAVKDIYTKFASTGAETGRTGGEGRGKTRGTVSLDARGGGGAGGGGVAAAAATAGGAGGEGREGSRSGAAGACCVIA